MKEFYYLNGEIVASEQAKIHVSDLGLLRGYGIFDFFRAMDGQAIFLEDHLDRLENSARLMHLPLLQTRQQISEAILEIIRLHPIPMLGVKVVLTGGYSPDGYQPAETPNLVIFGKPFTFGNPKAGLKWMSIAYEREIPEIKTTNYVVPIRHLPALKAGGFDDVLYHKNDSVSESSRSNVFIIKNEKVITPKNGVLFGITRKHVLAVARQHFEVEERDISVAEFFAADEIFTTGSTKRITPVTQVDGHIFNLGKVTQKLQALFLEHESGVLV
ncbi:MAG: aminotransferase class IV [Verrucomicrobia bacterium]|nr:aminotransferase class IV [Cytophagales bacterium]